MADNEDFDMVFGGLGDVLRDVGAGADLGALGKMGINTGVNLSTVTERYEDDEEMSDAELPDDSTLRPQRPYPAFIPYGQSAVGTPTYAPAKKTKKVTKRRLVTRTKTVQELFPSFDPNKPLNFVEIFGQRAKKPSRIWSRELPTLQETYPARKTAHSGFVRTVAAEALKEKEKKRVQKVVVESSLDAELEQALEARAEVVQGLQLDDRSFDMVNLSTWEDQIMYDSTMLPKARPAQRPALTAPTNAIFESGVWTQSIIWDAKAPFRDFTQLDLSHVEDVTYDDDGPTRVDPRPRKRLRTDAGPQVPKDKFNISNDHTYEAIKDNRLVRQTFGALEVEHAYPALKLQLPFYKIRLTKQECRSFHRFALQFPVNQEIKFNKVKTAPKLKDKAGRKLGKGGDFSEGLRRTGDLSLRDSSKFILWEYSEEHPPAISNFGMGSLIVNYYRKKDDKDEHIPKREFGTPFVLQPSDDTPFLKLGTVKPGVTVPSLYNNMVRAPLFEHKPSSSDFLVVRSTTNGESRYYIREIKHLFVIGQTIPVTEIPGPHSRKVTTTAKSRLQQICYRLLRKTDDERIRISQLPKYFPDQDEVQLKQRLKAHLQEFMEYQRKGLHQGYWRLKGNLTIPDEAAIVKMVKPEDVALTESMQVGQQQLLDAGFSGTTDDADDEQATIVKAKDGTPLTITQQLAPWMTTKNVLQAAQQKAMLKLYGEGDPTGRGEAFSYLKVSMKDVFVKQGEKKPEKGEMNKSGHRYNVQEQQKVYAEEKERIWNAQMRSLSRTDPPELTDEEEESKGKSRESPALADNTQPDSTGNYRVMKIRRWKNGQLRAEIVRDQLVITAYLRKKEQMKQNMLTEGLVPTGDAKLDAKAAKDLESQIAKLKRNQERRIDRKNKKIAKEGGEPLLTAPVVKSETSRKCGNCGEMGHMKTNRKCPRWHEFNKATPANQNQTPAASTFVPGMDPSLTAGAGFFASQNAAAIPSASSTKPAAAPAPSPFTRTAIPPRVQASYTPKTHSPLATSPPIVAPSTYGRQMSPVADSGNSSVIDPSLQ